MKYLPPVVAALLVVVGLCATVIVIGGDFGASVGATIGAVLFVVVASVVALVTD
jgi:hypothetical protein